MDKEKGDSSFHTVRRVRKILGVKKAGHAGTLDPFATGLLIILINQGTKLFPFIMSEEKMYRATICFGKETDSFDLTGNITAVRDVPPMDKEHIEERLKDFIGPIEQTPPVFSAVRQGGIRSYKLARKGINVELKKRSVYIYDIRIVSWNSPELILDIRCSPGTYIRSLAVDVARALGTLGYLKELRRISCGPFHVDDAISIGTEVNREFLEKRIISLVDALPNYKSIVVDDSMAWRLRNGFQPRLKGLDPGYVKFVKGDELVAIARVEEDGGIKLERVFN